MELWSPKLSYGAGGEGPELESWSPRPQNRARDLAMELEIELDFEMERALQTLNSKPFTLNPEPQILN